MVAVQGQDSDRAHLLSCEEPKQHVGVAPVLIDEQGLKRVLKYRQIIHPDPVHRDALQGAKYRDRARMYRTLLEIAWQGALCKKRTSMFTWHAPCMCLEPGSRGTHWR